MYQSSIEGSMDTVLQRLRALVCCPGFVQKSVKLVHDADGSL